MIKYLLFFILTLSLSTFGADKPDPCQLFEYCRGGGSSFKSRPSGSSPSSSSSAGLNPSTVSSIRGLGIEAIYQPGNPVHFGAASGNGRIGALISPNLENSFFGNRTIELNEVHLERQEKHKQYRNKKLNFASGFKLIKRKYVGLDLGVSVKRNEDVKNFNPGYGATLNLGPFHFGAYRYKDDIKIKFENYLDPNSGIPYALLYNSPSYTEKFWVETYTGGFRFQNFTFDAGVIKTRYKFYQENTRIYLYSASYNWRNFLFLGALRKEFSPNDKYVHGVMVQERKKEENYYGIQWLATRHTILGLNYNFFLLRELSASFILLF